jgi:hypothetical protein
LVVAVLDGVGASDLQPVPSISVTSSNGLPFCVGVLANDSDQSGVASGQQAQHPHPIRPTIDASM